MVPTREKQKLIQKFARHGTDTGSADVQVAVLSEEISRLSQHLKKHPKDHHSRRGLLGMVQRRKRLLGYLEQRSPQRHALIAKKVGIKK